MRLKQEKKMINEQEIEKMIQTKDYESMKHVLIWFLSTQSPGARVYRNIPVLINNGVLVFDNSNKYLVTPPKFKIDEEF
jgi:uncharacterized membrane-anchored protein